MVECKQTPLGLYSPIFACGVTDTGSHISNFKFIRCNHIQLQSQIGADIEIFRDCGIAPSYGSSARFTASTPKGKYIHIYNLHYQVTGKIIEEDKEEAKFSDEEDGEEDLDTEKIVRQFGQKYPKSDASVQKPAAKKGTCLQNESQCEIFLLCLFFM